MTRGVIGQCVRSFIAAAALLCGAFGCSSSSDIEDAIDDVTDVVDPERRPIDTSRLGINAFVNDARFGSISGQFREVRDTLRIGRVRALFAWNDGVQPSPGAAPDFTFYDEIVDSIPDGVEVFVVLTGVPGWMSDSGNWTEGNPRTTFVERWVRPVAERYAARGRIAGFQIWNEPNMLANPDNVTLGMANEPEHYVEMLARAFSVMRDVSPQKLVISAATTAINQNFPETLDYNRRMRDAGAVGFSDVFAVHYYGRQFENVVRGNGVGDFLRGLGARIWITESGEQGVDNQLQYGEETWPFLLEEIPEIERIYVYQFTEATPADVTYGLRNLTPGAELSNLYIFLRDR